MLGLAACGDGENDPGKPRVVATTPHVADLVRSAGGDRIEVTQLLPANADPHDYEPRPSNAKAVAEADLVVRSGGEVDEWLDGVVENAGGSAPTLTLLDAVRKRDDDPHWWQDPRNAIAAVGAIRGRLGEIDPGEASAYDRNAARYVRRLRRLDREIAACIARVPARQRKLVTSHDSLGYYADRYGLELVGALIPALSSQAQPSAGDTARLVRQIDRQDVRAIFPESSLNPKLEHAVARETGAKVGDELYADTLGAKGSAEATYIGALAANTASLVKGLSGGELSCRPRA